MALLKVWGLCLHHHRARHTLVLMARLDFGVPKDVPVGPQVEVVEPADESVVAVEFEAASICVVGQLLGYRRPLCAAHRLTFQRVVT
ncbi:hypothetical protein [Streptomyces fagopyri]|uniref:hypothetical protein n=1 Tax=Streptomyces fagopyri TaxID=2662397 RepID=UPI0033F673C6